MLLNERYDNPELRFSYQKQYSEAKWIFNGDKRDNVEIFSQRLDELAAKSQLDIDDTQRKLRFLQSCPMEIRLPLQQPLTDSKMSYIQFIELAKNLEKEVSNQFYLSNRPVRIQQVEHEFFDYESVEREEDQSQQQEYFNSDNKNVAVNTNKSEINLSPNITLPCGLCTNVNHRTRQCPYLRQAQQFVETQIVNNANLNSDDSLKGSNIDSGANSTSSIQNDFAAKVNSKSNDPNNALHSASSQ